jgi:hypothetical protein
VAELLDRRKVEIGGLHASPAAPKLDNRLNSCGRIASGLPLSSGHQPVPADNGVNRRWLYAQQLRHFCLLVALLGRIQSNPLAVGLAQIGNEKLDPRSGQIGQENEAASFDHPAGATDDLSNLFWTSAFGPKVCFKVGELIQQGPLAMHLERVRINLF